MLKYYVFMFLILGIALVYVFIKDPCNQQVRADFLNEYPNYQILSSDASEGSPESVRCHISYRKPDSEQVHEAIWLYQYSSRGWEFSKVLKTHTPEQTSEDQDEHALDGGLEASPEF